jgi:hypothetical protein
MLFHISYEYPPEQRDDVHDRFRETGAPPPAGVEMTGRWHCIEGNRGFLVAESTDAEAVARWLQEWTDVLSFEVTPVLTDEQFTEVIS